MRAGRPIEMSGEALESEALIWPKRGAVLVGAGTWLPQHGGQHGEWYFAHPSSFGTRWMIPAPGTRRPPRLSLRRGPGLSVGNDRRRGHALTPTPTS
jgi:hypothetical protein